MLPQVSQPKSDTNFANSQGTFEISHIHKATRCAPAKGFVNSEYFQPGGLCFSLYSTSQWHTYKCRIVKVGWSGVGSVVSRFCLSYSRWARLEGQLLSLYFPTRWITSKWSLSAGVARGGVRWIKVLLFSFWLGRILTPTDQPVLPTPTAYI